MSGITQIFGWISLLLAIVGVLGPTFAPETIGPRLQLALFSLVVIFMAVAFSASSTNVPYFQNLARSGTLKIISFISLFVLIFCSVLHFSIPKKEETSLLLLPPEHRYKLTWDPLTNLQIITRPSDKTVEAIAGYRLPIFRLKNLGKEVARDIKVEWLITEDLLGEKVATSERLQKYKTSIINNAVSMEKTTNNKTEGWTNYISFHEMDSYEYLSPQIDNNSYMEINMPDGVYGVLEIIFVAELSNGPAMLNQVSKKFDVKISYNENGKNIKNKYTVNATALSVKPWSNGIVKIPIDGEMREPPEIMAEVKFNVTR